MLTARRMRERQEAEASGNAPPPRPARRQDIPWHEHEGALVALETRLRAELAQASTYTLNVDSSEFQAMVKPMVEEFEARARGVVERNDELSKQLDLVATEKAELQGKLALALDSNKSLAEELEILTSKAAVLAQELLEWQAAADVPAAKAELAAEPETPAPVDVADATAPAATEDSSKPKGGKPKGK